MGTFTYQNGERYTRTFHRDRMRRRAVEEKEEEEEEEEEKEEEEEEEKEEEEVVLRPKTPLGCLIGKLEEGANTWFKIP